MFVEGSLLRVVVLVRYVNTEYYSEYDKEMPQSQLARLQASPQHGEEEAQNKDSLNTIKAIINHIYANQFSLPQQDDC